MKQKSIRYRFATLFLGFSIILGLPKFSRASNLVSNTNTSSITSIPGLGVESIIGPEVKDSTPGAVFGSVNDNVIFGSTDTILFDSESEVNLPENVEKNIIVKPLKIFTEFIDDHVPSTFTTQTSENENFQKDKSLIIKPLKIYLFEDNSFSSSKVQKESEKKSFFNYELLTYLSNNALNSASEISTRDIYNNHRNLRGINDTKDTQYSKKKQLRAAAFLPVPTNFFENVQIQKVAPLPKFYTESSSKLLTADKIGIDQQPHIIKKKIVLSNNEPVSRDTLSIPKDMTSFNFYSPIVEKVFKLITIVFYNEPSKYSLEGINKLPTVKNIVEDIRNKSLLTENESLKTEFKQKSKKIKQKHGEKTKQSFEQMPEERRNEINTLKTRPKFEQDSARLQKKEDEAARKVAGRLKPTDAPTASPFEYPRVMIHLPSEDDLIPLRKTWREEIRAKCNNTCFFTGVSGVSVEKKYPNGTFMRDKNGTIVTERLVNIHHPYGQKEFILLKTDGRNGVLICRKLHKAYHKEFDTIGINWHTFCRFIEKHDDLQVRSRLKAFQKAFPEILPQPERYFQVFDTGIDATPVPIKNCFYVKPYPSIKPNLSVDLKPTSTPSVDLEPTSTPKDFPKDSNFEELRK